MANFPAPSDTHDNPVFKELVSVLGNGFILSLFTIDFFCFEYLLPILGSFIMLYGCHLVKEHSIYFKRTYIFACIRSLTMLANFMIDWTRFHDNITITYLQIGIAAVLIIGIFFNLNQAFKDIFHKANAVEHYNNRLNQYIVLYLCTIFSTYLTIHLGTLGAMLSLFLLILNICFLMLTFYQLGNSLSKLDCDLVLTYYSIPEKRRLIGFLATYIAALTLLVIVSNKALFLPVRPSSQLGSNESQQGEIEKRLLDLGFDKEALHTLPKEEIALLANASSLSSDTSVKEINNGTLSVTLYHIFCKEDYRVIAYYKWLTPPDSRLYEVMEVQFNNWTSMTDITSKTYVEKEDHSLELSNLNIGQNSHSYPYVQHKLPNTGDKISGYLSFSYKPNSKTIPKFTLYVYSQISVFNLPYVSIIDYMNDFENYKNSMIFDQNTLTFSFP